MGKILSVIVFVWVVQTSAFANTKKLTVIHESWDTVTTEKYIGYFQKESLDIDLLNTPRIKKEMYPDVPYKYTFPTSHVDLTLGKIRYRQMKVSHGVTPFFIISYDEPSLQWIKARQQLLVQHRAVGIAININSRKDFEHLEKLVAPLKIYPLNGMRIVKLLRLKHYPVLISSQGIEQ